MDQNERNHQLLTRAESALQYFQHGLQSTNDHLNQVLKARFCNRLKLRKM